MKKKLKISKCTICKKEYLDTSSSVNKSKKVCPICQKSKKESQQKIRNYIKNNPKISIIELTKNLNISEEIVVECLKAGIIETTKKSPTLLSCLKCGEPIRSGEYCEKCKRKGRRVISIEVGNTVKSFGKSYSMKKKK